MKRVMSTKMAAISVAAVLLVELLGLPALSPAQEEVASAIRRYKDREVSTGYYEEYEALPHRQRPWWKSPGSKGTLPVQPTAAQVRSRTHLADSHQGIKFYWNLRCQICHLTETTDIHTTRANLTCRQCHGGEP